MNNINIDKIVETIAYWLTTYSVKIIAAILIFIIGKWLAGKISRLITKLLTNECYSQLYPESGPCDRHRL